VFSGREELVMRRSKKDRWRPVSLGLFLCSGLGFGSGSVPLCPFPQRLLRYSDVALFCRCALKYRVGEKTWKSRSSIYVS
jgi:hypothetical protein